MFQKKCVGLTLHRNVKYLKGHSTYPHSLIQPCKGLQVPAGASASMSRGTSLSPPWWQEPAHSSFLQSSSAPGRAPSAAFAGGLVRNRARRRVNIWLFQDSRCVAFPSPEGSLQTHVSPNSCLMTRW